MEEPDIYEHIGDVQYSLGGWAEAVVAWERRRRFINKCGKRSANQDRYGKNWKP